MYCMYSKPINHFSLYPILLDSVSSSILIPGLPVSFNPIYNDNMAPFQQSSKQIYKKNKKQLVIYTSLLQVEMNQDNIIWQGNGWPVIVLHGCVKKWAATALYALCLWESQRRSEKKRKGWTRGKERQREMGRRERWLAIQYKRERIMRVGAGAEERQGVCCRYPSKTNLYCIKISGW